MLAKEPSEIAVSLTNLYFEWSPQQATLDIPSLTLAVGERVFVEGPSGSGKTTLLNLISGIIAPTSGSVSILGTDLGALSAQKRDAFRADTLGIIFQQFNLLPYLNVVDNVALSCRFSKARRQRIAQAKTDEVSEAKRLLSALNLEGEILSRPVSSLSVGQQQRVAVARALIGHPPVVIADEPTSALDLPMRDTFLDLLFDVCESEKTTLIFVSHDPTIASRFNRHIPLANINRAVAENAEGMGA